MTRQPQVQPVQLDPRYFEHRKARAVGLHGRELHLRMLCFANRNLTDGRLTHEQALEIAECVFDQGPMLVPPTVDECRVLVASVVTAGLLDENGAGYLIHDFAEYQPTRAKLDQRATWRVRKRAQRGTDPVDKWDVHPLEGDVPPTDSSCSSSVGDNPQLSSALSELSPSAVTDENQDSENSSPGRGTPRWFASQLRGSDQRTAAAIQSVQRQYGLPEAALHAALELVRERRPDSEPGYFIRCLQGFGKEGRYAA